MKKNSMKKKAAIALPLVLAGSMIGGSVSAFADETAVAGSEASTGIPAGETPDGPRELPEEGTEDTPGGTEGIEGAGEEGTGDEEAAPGVVNGAVPGAAGETGETGEGDNTVQPPANEEENAGEPENTEAGPVAEGEDSHDALVDWEKNYEETVANEVEKERPADEDTAEEKTEPTWKGWTKDTLINLMNDLNEEFETEGFKYFINKIKVAETDADLDKIMKELETKNGITVGEYKEEKLPGGNTKPGEGTKPGGEVKPGSDTKPGAEVKPGEDIKPDGVAPTEEGKLAGEKTDGVVTSDKTVPVGSQTAAAPQASTVGGLAQTGIDGGIITAGLVAGALGFVAKRRKSDEQ